MTTRKIWIVLDRYHLTHEEALADYRELTAMGAEVKIEEDEIFDVEGLGRDNALIAIDQVGDYANLQDAIDNYRDNLHDTLVEEGLNNPQAHAAAERAFDAVLTARGIKI